MRIARSVHELCEKRWVKYGLFPALLILFCMVGTGRGVDLSDTTYSLGNYRFLRELKGDWIYATGLANLSGYILLQLSGNSMLLMTILCRLIIVAAALIPYIFLAREKSAFAAFFGEWIAIGFCWCPAVILYNYLSYLLFALAALLLYRGSRTGSGKADAIAGILLGLALFVRISNLTYCALILYVWISAVIRYGRITKKLWIRTGVCIGAYMIGVILGLLLTVFGLGGGEGNGIGGMISWVTSLATSGDTAGGYSLGAMLLTVCKAYFWAAQRFLPLAAVAGIGILLMHFLKGKSRKQLLYPVLAVVILLVFVLYYRRGVFTTLYYNNGSVYGIGAVLLVLLYLIFCGVLFFGRGFTVEEKEEALLGLLLILIAPLGTNNHLYAVLNQMFLFLPIALRLLGRALEKCREEIAHPVYFTIAAFMALLLIQTTGFRIGYSFVDGEDGADLSYCMESPETLCGMRTSKGHADTIVGLMECKEVAEAGTLLAYGKLPGLHYVSGIAPALSTLWPELESYPEDDFRTELAEVGEKNIYPVVIISKEAFRRVEGAADAAAEETAEKDRDLSVFLTENGYEIKYRTDELVLYAR